MYKQHTFLIKLISVFAVVLLGAFMYFIWGAHAGETINVTIKTQTALKDGLVGHWTFDGDNMLQNIEDVTNRGNTGYMESGFSTSTAAVRGKIGQAMHTVGKTVDLLNPTDFNFSSTK